MLGITGHAVHSDASLAHLVTTPTLTYHYPLHFRDIHQILTGKRGKWGSGLYFFFLAKIWSCRKMPCHQCSVSSWAAWFLSPVNKLFCVSSLAAAELMRRILSLELCHRTCWTSLYFHKSLIKKCLQWCFFCNNIVLCSVNLIFWLMQSNLLSDGSDALKVWWQKE